MIKNMEISRLPGGEKLHVPGPLSRQRAAPVTERTALEVSKHMRPQTSLAAFDGKPQINVDRQRAALSARVNNSPRNLSQIRHDKKVKAALAKEVRRQTNATSEVPAALSATTGSAVRQVKETVGALPSMVGTIFGPSSLAPGTLAVVAAGCVVAVYIYRSHKEGGMDFGDGVKRSIFRWVDAAAGAALCLFFINFARTIY